MIVYVDLEHKRVRHTPVLWKYLAASVLQTKYRLEAISGDLCLVVPYDRVTLNLLYELNIRAVIVSGNHTAFQHYAEENLAGLRAIFKEAAWPTLSFCGGFQLMAQTYGADIGPMEVISSDAADYHLGSPLPPDLSEQSADSVGPDVKQEHGFMPVDLLQPHPLFDGLEHRLVFYQSHFWEVKSLPKGFRLLAESPLCKVQTIAYDGRPLFGTQFHPELYDETHSEGRKLLESFFRIAGVIT